MRKYFNIKLDDRESARLHTSGDNLAWVMIEATAKASALNLPWPELCDAISVIQRKSVSDYLELGARHLSTHSTYVGRGHQSICSSRQLWSLFSKYPWSRESLDIDRTAAAKQKWQQAEDQCKATNARLRNVTNGELPAFIHKARGLIFEVLGEVRPQIAEMLSLARPGKGATCSNKNSKGRVTAYYKFADFPYTCTREALPYGLAAISMDPSWVEILEMSGRRREVPVGVSRAQSEMMLFSDCVDIAATDTITFVPKNAKTDRPIAVGASLNIMLQLGVNAWLTRRLKAFGVNLRDQGRNQMFAYLGSRHCLDEHGNASPSQFSTIDLASASDTIATELVRLLLPSDWFAFLDDLRHKSGQIDGQEVLYEKFSAMGNGYTFPLESLIFWAVSKAAIEVEGLRCKQDDIAVYGDDIIIRNYGSTATIQALEYCGFSINREKSFVSGHFKESCGSDYWMGQDVRPIYIKRTLTDVSALYYIANMCASRCVVGRGYPPAYYQLYTCAINAIDRRDRRYGPLDLFDPENPERKEVGIPESFLSVPLCSLRHPGLNPWVTPAEYRHLSKLRLYSEAPAELKAGSPTVPTMVWYSSTPKSFTGRASIRYYLALRAKHGIHCSGDFLSLEDLLHVEAASAGQVTRRGILTTKVKARTVPNWDGRWGPHEVARHPAVLMGLA